MPKSKTIAVVCTLDTKGPQAQFVMRLIEQSGHRALLVDTGVTGTPPFAAGVSREEVAREAGISIQALVDLRDRGKALAAMTAGATALVARWHREGKIDGILGMGGGSGTAIASAVMRGLPFGVPKMMISTMSSGEVGRYVGTKDIAMLNSVTDIMRLNHILRRILTNGVGAIVGMVEAADRAIGLEGEPPKPTIAITAFGVTNSAAMRCHALLEEAGFNTMIFHANGTGGRAMEELIAQGAIDGVLDLTTTELADELCGGILSAGPHRLEAAGARGLPQVVLPGAMDMVNFGPLETVPPKYTERRLYCHNPGTTLMRTTADENRILGRWVGEKLAKATGPSVLLLPLLGFSEYDREGCVFHDPEADGAFMAAAALGSHTPVVRLNYAINDPACADRAVALLLDLIWQSTGRGRDTSRGIAEEAE
jgi:uncharacterized protein (UPF0261 family)